MHTGAMPPADAQSLPLLVVDAPSLLFRAYYALPASIKDGEGRPVNALLGSVNMMLQEIDAPRPARGRDGLRPGRRRLPRRAVPRLPRRPPRAEEDETSSGSSTQAPDLYAAFGWETRRVPGLEADDVLGSYALAEQEAGGTRPDPDRRPGHVPVRRTTAARCST